MTLRTPDMGYPPASRPPPVVPPSLDPLESTPPSAPALPSRRVPDWPLAAPAEGFRLVSESNGTPPPSDGRTDPDAPLSLELVKQRAVAVANWNAGIHFRHHTWEADRRRVLNALEFPGVGGRRYWRFRDCGTEPIVFRHPDEPGRFKVGCKRCHDRFCLPCSQDRARLIVANLKEQLDDEPTRFLTLTLKHNNEPLPDQLDRLYDCFRALRRRVFWTDRVTGGVAFLELKLGRGDSLWHPHLHVLIRGKYLPQKALADAWLNVTGDSHVVDVRMARSPEHVYRYLAGYVTKGWSSGLYRNADRLAEAVLALRGRKLLACFGSFVKLHLLRPPTPETWVIVGTLADLRDRARLCDPEALQVLAAISAPGFTPALVTVPPDE